MKRIIQLIAATILSFSFLVSYGDDQMDTLTPREQSIVTISALTAKGDLPKLQEALAMGLSHELTVNEIKEVLIQLYAYTGFPRSLNGLTTFMNLLEDRKDKGIHDIIGDEPTAIPNNTTSLALGTEVQTALVGASVSGGVMDFAPGIDQFLKAHLFGDIFGRNVLSYQDREIATIAALSALNGVDGQIQSHLNIAQNTGITINALKEITTILQETIGDLECDRLNRALKAISQP